PPAPPASPPPAAGADRLTALKQLGELHKQGVLTDDEFNAEKAKILAS
ncbi:SHOCT domain-containing protein, partial [Rhodococcus opacus]